MAAKAELRAFLGLNTKEFERNLAKARTKANDFATKGIKVASAAVVTFGAVLAVGTKRLVAMGAELEHTRIQTGLSVKQNILLSRTLADAGVKVTDFGKRIQRMQDSLVRAEKGSARQADALAEIGLSATDLLRMEPGKQMEEIAVALSKIEDPARRSSIAMALLGQRGADFLLSLSPEALEETRKHLGRFPEVMDQFAGAFERADTLMGRLPDKANQFFTGFGAGVIGSILGPLEEVNNFDFTTLGENLGLAVAPWIEAIKSGDIWELFSLHATKAVLKFGALIIDGFGNAMITVGAMLWGTFKAAGVVLKNIFLEAVASMAESLGKIEPPEWVRYIPGIGKAIESGLQKASDVASNIREGQETAKDPAMIIHETIANSPELKFRAGVDEMFDPAIAEMMDPLRAQVEANRASAASIGRTDKPAGGEEDEEVTLPSADYFSRAGESFAEATAAEQTPEEQERQRLWNLARGDIEGRTVEGRRARMQLVDSGELSRHAYDRTQQLINGPDMIEKIDEEEQKKEQDKTATMADEMQRIRELMEHLFDALGAPA